MQPSTDRNGSQTRDDRQATKTSGAPRNRHIRRRRILFGVLAVVLFVVIGSWRTTPPTLSEGSKQLLASLKQSVYVEAYVTRGAPDVDECANDIELLLAAYKRANGGQFHYEVIEAKTPEEEERARSKGLEKLNFYDSVPLKFEATAPKGFLGVVVRYGEQEATIPFVSLNQTRGLEYAISKKIRDLFLQVHHEKLRIGLIVGKGEPWLSDIDLIPIAEHGRPTGTLNGSIPSYYSFEALKIDAEARIDPTLAGLLIPQPRADFSDAELERIDEFVLAGKSLVVVASAVHFDSVDTNIHATLTTHRLDKLLSGYGLEMQTDVVGSRSHSLVYVPESFALPRPQPDPALPEIFSTPLDLGRTSQTLPPGIPWVAFASSIVLHPERQPTASLRIVENAPHDAYIIRTSPVDFGPWERKGAIIPSEPLIIAAAAEGPLVSTFGRGAAAPGARILLVSSSRLLSSLVVGISKGQNEQAPANAPDAVLMQVVANKYLRNFAPKVPGVIEDIADWMTIDPLLNQAADLPIVRNGWDRGLGAYLQERVRY